MPYKDREKQREYQRKWMQNRRFQWLNENGPCVVCGSSEELEVDHIEESEKLDHRVWSWSDTRRLVELAKCQVLCAKCHREKTNAFLAKPDNHGTQNAYNRYGCRCDICVTYMKSQWKRRDRRKHIVEPLGQTVIYNK